MWIDFRLQAVTTHFAQKLRRLAAVDHIAKTAGVAGYAQAVLVPELAVLLVKEDMKVNDESARRILRDSIAIGEKLNAQLNDAVPIPKELEEDQENREIMGPRRYQVRCAPANHLKGSFKIDCFVSDDIDSLKEKIWIRLQLSNEVTHHSSLELYTPLAPLDLTKTFQVTEGCFLQPRLRVDSIPASNDSNIDVIVLSGALREDQPLERNDAICPRDQTGLRSFSNP